MNFAFWKKSGEHTAGQVDFNRLPRHIAIILDGNGRWAKKRGLPRTAGHKVGAETFRTIATYCRDIGIEYLTVYAFSTENWKRPAEEVSAIMELLRKYLEEAIATMERDRVRLCVIGDMTPLTPELRALVERCNAIAQTVDGCQCNLCINYGGRLEMMHAAQRFAEDCIAGTHRPQDLTESIFESYLYTAHIPSPELLIRPSGEQRLSNFLLWQCAYAELYFTPVLWPDFTREDLHEAIIAYQKRDRRFGGIK